MFDCLIVFLIHLSKHIYGNIRHYYQILLFWREYPPDLYPHERILMSLPRPDTASNTALHTSTLHTAHKTLQHCTPLHTEHCTLHIKHVTLQHCTQCTLHIKHYTLQGVWDSIEAPWELSHSDCAQCTLNAEHCKLNAEHCTLSVTHFHHVCTMYIH